MLNWFLIYTKPRCEESVSAKFVEHGFEVLNPKIEESKYIRRKKQDVISPLFPCYIFVKFELTKNYRFVKYARGVKNIVGTSNMPSIVPESIISQIRERTAGGAVRVKPLSFASGEEVAISCGPFEGLGAVFEKELKGSERVAILLRAINARVVVDAAILKKTQTCGSKQ